MGQNKVICSIRFVPWMLLILSPAFGYRVLHLKRHEGQSVDISCATEKRTKTPLGFSLSLKTEHPERTLLFIFYESVEIAAQYKDRVVVHGSLSGDRLNATIGPLEQNDTGLYLCQFIYDAHPIDETVLGQEGFFVVVEEVGVDAPVDPCSCSSYTTLLYAISAATAVLVLVLLCLCASRLRTCQHRKPPNPHPVPIYEEMTGARTNTGKDYDSHLAPSDKEPMKLYGNSKLENYYESPKNALLAQKAHSPES